MIKANLNKGDTNLVVTSIHSGHHIRGNLLPYFKLSSAQRLREEDPYTNCLTCISDNRIELKTSRFEVDVNRPITKAVYRKPEDAWGLDLYHGKLPNSLIKNSYRYYKHFYKKVRTYIQDLLQAQDYLIIYDLHSYNHQREEWGKFAEPQTNPEINIGTGNISKQRWKKTIKTLLHQMKNYNYRGRYLDVRTDIKFQGGHFGKWLVQNFGNRVCPVAIEFKKFFMNEWTGECDRNQISCLTDLLTATIHPVLDSASKDYHS